MLLLFGTRIIGGLAAIMTHRTMLAPVHAKSTNAVRRAFVALIALVAALPMPAAGAALDGVRPAVSEQDDDLPTGEAHSMHGNPDLSKGISDRRPLYALFR
jgi:hypothetical protein